MPGVASRMRRPVFLFNGFTRFLTTGNSHHAARRSDRSSGGRHARLRTRLRVHATRQTAAHRDGRGVACRNARNSGELKRDNTPPPSMLISIIERERFGIS